MWWVSSFNLPSSAFKKKNIYYISYWYNSHPSTGRVSQNSVRSIDLPRGLHCSFPMVWVAHFYCSLLGSWAGFPVVELDTIMGRVTQNHWCLLGAGPSGELLLRQRPSGWKESEMRPGHHTPFFSFCWCRSSSNSTGGKVNGRTAFQLSIFPIIILKKLLSL